MFPSDNLEAEFTLETGEQPIPEDPSFKILLVGDWSGRESSEGLENAQPPRPVEVDRDNFDAVFRKFNAKLDLDPQLDGKDFIHIRLGGLDDFHPDRIFRQLPLFTELRELRGRLLDPNAFDRAASEARSLFGWQDEVAKTGGEGSAIENEVEAPASEGLLDQILSQPTGAGTSAKPTESTAYKDLNRFISKVVEPYLVQTDENELARLLGAIDAATSDLMRWILHHPKFQALESAWRGVYMMVREIETDVDLKLYLFDIGKNELSDNLKSVKKLSDSFLYRHLITDTIETPGGEPFAAVCGNYTFGSDLEDVALLIRLAKLSKTANAPFFSQASAQMLGISSLAESPDHTEWRPANDSPERRLWTTLRELPEARFLGLAMPRFLARLPYGKDTEPTEAFAFEEFTDNRNHEEYLWANPSFICGQLLAKSFRSTGWNMRDHMLKGVSGLPTHIYEEDGEKKTKPCAEVLLTEKGCEMILEQGIMPLISYRNADRVQLARFQSIASPLCGLSGRWN